LSFIATAGESHGRGRGGPGRGDCGGGCDNLGGKLKEMACALVAQWQSSRLLSGWLQVQVLPGALERGEREARRVMERLISLFREPDYESWSPSDPQPPPPAESEEPLYFKQLLAYLREHRAAAGEQSAQADEAGELIGA
jgi:hypothetical protein